MTMNQTRIIDDYICSGAHNRAVAVARQHRCSEEFVRATIKEAQHNGEYQQRLKALRDKEKRGK